MFWSLLPLVLACVALAGLAGTCAFRPGGITPGPVPAYDAAAALKADAQTFGFPVRLPQLPDGWKPNSGTRGSITDGRSDATGQRLRAVTSRVGYISPTGMYVSLTQSNADEVPLVASISVSSGCLMTSLIRVSISLYSLPRPVSPSGRNCTHRI